MFGWLKKTYGSLVFPVQGKCISIEEVKDETFAKKIMGNGFAVIPTGHDVLAPVAGELISIAKTKHAFGILTNAGEDVLVHVGVDTVKLKGEGFTFYQAKGSHVKAGEKILSFDSAFLKLEEMDMTTMIVFIDKQDEKIGPEFYGKMVEAGEVIKP